MKPIKPMFIRRPSIVSCPVCHKQMQYLNSKGPQDIYGCTNGHVKRVARSGQTPPDAA